MMRLPRYARNDNEPKRPKPLLIINEGYFYDFEIILFLCWLVK